MDYAPRDPDHAAVLADPDPNTTACRSAFQRASSGKVKSMGRLRFRSGLTLKAAVSLSH